MKLYRRVLGVNGGPTLGRMVSNDGKFECVTLERPVDDPVHPCVPAKAYNVHEATHHPDGPHPYPCPELDTADIGRTHIQIHVLNTVAESLGCIGPGNSVSDDGQAIDDSKVAFDRLMAYLGNSFPFTLEIFDPPAEQADGSAISS